jgi:hypothetical protein
MNIRKVKLIRSGCLEVTYFDGEGNEVNMKGVNQVHRDLKKAMKRLVPFFCELTEQKEANDIDWFNLESEDNEKRLSHLDVSGVTLSGDDSFESLVITGKRSLSVTNKVLNLNSSVSLDSEAEEYGRVSDLQEAVDAVLEEAKLYVTEHKYGVVQQEFNFEAKVDDPFAEGDAGESAQLNNEEAE